MNYSTFTDLVKKYFGFLETNHNFKINLETNSPTRPQTDGVVEYVSNSISVVIDSENGSAAVWFYRTQDGKKYDLDPVAIHEYITTSDEEKKLLLSTNPDDSIAANALFNQKFLLNQSGWKHEGDTQDKLEIRLINYANWLKIHEELCLRGEIVNWLEFYQYKTYRARAEHIRLGNDELGYVRIQDADGKWKLIKQSVFKDELEYIERLINLRSR